jgi:hypothetical protein
MHKDRFLKCCNRYNWAGKTRCAEAEVSKDSNRGGETVHDWAHEPVRKRGSRQEQDGAQTQVENARIEDEVDLCLMETRRLSEAQGSVVPDEGTLT